jgi:hypothetical protein
VEKPSEGSESGVRESGPENDRMNPIDSVVFTLSVTRQPPRNALAWAVNESSHTVIVPEGVKTAVALLWLAREDLVLQNEIDVGSHPVECERELEHPPGNCVYRKRTPPRAVRLGAAVWTFLSEVRSATYLR